jgi:pSer/pThr/pTyr-binding forkhead associated (FHA) protein
MWILRTQQGLEPTLTFRLMPGTIKTLGRAVRADFIVDAAMVSRLHCRLTALPTGQLEVEDLQSTNGTYVNGKRIVKATLLPGDTLRVGRVELALVHAPLQQVDTTLEAGG